MTSSSSYADHFGIENIPFGIASSRSHSSPQGATRFENTIIFLNDLAEHFTSANLPKDIFLQSTLNAFGALGRKAHQDVRKTIQSLIQEEKLSESSKEEVTAVQMLLPVSVGDFTDFSCSPTHNRNAGQALLGMSRGLPPGYLHMPLGKSVAQTQLTIGLTMCQVMRADVPASSFPAPRSVDREGCTSSTVLKDYKERGRM